MRFAVTFVARVVGLAGTFAHDGVSDDERWARSFLVSLFECFADLFAVVAVNFDDVPVPGAILHGSVFRNHFRSLC